MTRSLLFAALLAAPAVALSGPPAGQIDPTFGEFDNGILGLQIEGFDLGGSLDDLDDAAHAMAEDAQGRLIVAGVAETDAGYCLGLMRFTSDGQFDTNGFGFNANQVAKGKICHPILTAGDDFRYFLDIAMLADGGFVVAGVVNLANPYVCRFHADGSKVNSFGDGQGCTIFSQIDSGGYSPAPTVLVLGESLLIVANDVQNARSSPVLARVSIASGLTEPFGQAGFVPLLSSTADAFVRDATLTADGDVMFGGRIEVDPDDVDAFVARFQLQELMPDLGFSGDGMARFKFNKIPKGQDYFQAITLSPHGDVVAAGNIESAEGPRIAAVQLDAATGAMSADFNSGQPKTFDPCSALPNGCGDLYVYGVARTGSHVVVSGEADYKMFATRLKADGGVDKRFGQQGLALIDLDTNTYQYGNGFIMQGERIVIAGSAGYGSDENFALLRLSDGRLFKDEFEAASP